MKYLAIDTYATRAFRNASLCAIHNKKEHGMHYAKHIAPTKIDICFPPFVGFDGIVTHTKDPDRFDLILQYVLKHGVPIVAWDMPADSYRERFIRDLKHIYPEGYRIAVVVYVTTTFGHTFYGRRKTVYIYKKDKVFNLTPPTLGKVTFPWDCIKDLRHREVEANTDPAGNKYLDTYYVLRADEMKILRYLRTGEDYSSIKKIFLSDRLQSIQYFDYTWPHRLSWTAFVPRNFDEYACKLIHPKQNRPLALREIYAMLGLSESEMDLYPDLIGLGGTTIPQAGDWIIKNMDLYLANAWKPEQDISADYDRKMDGKWTTKPADPTEIKYYDLLRYANEEYDPYDYPGFHK